MMNFIRLLRKSIFELKRYPGFLLIAWLVVMLALPFLYRMFGEQILLQGLALVVLLQVAFVLNVLYRAWGWWGMLRTAIEVVLFAWVVQAIVIRSGLPYGNLRYTHLLQPQVLGIPMLIPLLWLMMLPPAWAVAKLITYNLTGCLMRITFILFSAIAFTAWGFFIDPLLAHLGLLQWTPSGGLYGTPWLNYTGWLLVSGVLYIFGGLIVAALIGFSLMGTMLLLAALSAR
jgi:uncharacterized membrane protein